MSDFEIENGLLWKYQGPGGDVVIPEGVTAIGWFTFSGCSSLTGVVIPAGVTYIGEKAFAGCSALTSVKLPDGVTSIGSEAFRGCRGLTRATIPDSVTSIGSEAFKGCTSLADEQGFVIIRGVLYDFIKKDAVDVTIPENVASIDGRAFEHCTALEAVRLPDDVKKIGRAAFQGCTNLRRLSVPAGLDSVGDWAFNQCNALSQIEMRGGQSQELINALFVWPGKWCFANALLTEDGQMPDSIRTEAVNHLRRNKDEYAKKLISQDDARGMDRLLSFWKKAKLDFVDACLTAAIEEGKPAVTALLIEYKNKYYPPEKLDAIAQDQADKAMGMKELSISDWRKVYKLSTNGDGATVSGYKGSDTALEIPDRVGKYKVTAIGKGAFKNCSGLVSVTIPEGVLSIGEKAFSDCEGLKNMVLPSSVTAIGERAFEYCHGLTSVTIPGGVTNVSANAFAICNGLTSITFLNGVATIGGSAFFACDSLTSVTIPDSVTSIGEWAFRWCKGLTSVTIPANVINIGKWAFEGCPDLTIHAPAGSYAEQYAKENSIPFAAI